MIERTYDVPREVLRRALEDPKGETHSTTVLEDAPSFQAQQLPYNSSDPDGFPQRVRITVTDPHPLALTDETAHKLVEILMTHVGETGKSEGAVEVLERLSAAYRQLQATEAKRIELQGAVVREARWFSENVYPPDVWTPDANPPAELGEGEKAAKRLNAALKALTDWKHSHP